ncbi:MAG: hypothetical protein SR1Q5_02300 [Quinella sp. 1Q5]|nr:hypothetical protein [Quinella sp. 1Q5]
MLGNSFDNKFIKIKVLGVNTASDGELSGGLEAINYMLEKSLPSVNYLAIDRQDTSNLAACKAAHKFRLLDMADERALIRNLRGTDLIFMVVDEVWENIKAVAIAAHCAKKSGATMILIAGGNFQDAEDEIIFDAVLKLSSEDFATNASNIVETFIAAMTLPGYPKLDFKTFAEFVKDSAATVGYGEAKNSVAFAANRALKHFVNAEDFKAATRILFSVTAPKEKFSLDRAEKLSKLVKRYAPAAEVSFGFSVDDWLVRKVKFLIIAAQ